MPERIMIFGLRMVFSIVPLLLLSAPSIATDFTYKEYMKASDAWKRGFVFAISRYVSVVAQPDEEAPYPVRTAFEQCLSGATDELLVRQVDAYVTRNPATSNGPMVAVVMRTLFAKCRPEIEKVRSPGVIPNRR
jgi:hypothetical protein